MKEIEIYGDYIQLDQFLKKENIFLMPTAAYLIILVGLSKSVTACLCRHRSRLAGDSI